MIPSPLSTAWRKARRRAHLRTLSLGLPWTLLAPALAWRLGTPGAFWPSLLVGWLALAAIAVLNARRRDRPWLQRRLDTQPVMEDSADLLFTDGTALGPLQRLQRERVLGRLPKALPALREPWPVKPHLAMWFPAWLLLAAIVLWPSRPLATIAAAPKADGTPRTLALRQAQLMATPPAYTGQRPATLPTLDARVPEGTQLRWELRIDGQPRSVALQFADGRRQPLQDRGDGHWQTGLQLTRSLLYRVVIEDRQLDLHRLQAVPDRAPQVRVLEPDNTLVLWDPARQRWPLRFEASDDYGVLATASLKVTLAQGSGENIHFSEQRMSLTGTGPATARRFARDLDPVALGLTPGDDLIVQLEVRDTRSPQAQSARSSSIVLRWPPPQQQLTTDLEASVRKTLPAYFRSQRQIIIDAEALLKQKRSLDADTFLKRSDAIGVDQRILRMRYGQFLGEESEGSPQAPPTGDAHDDDAHEGHEPASATLPVADDLPTADAAPTSEPRTADLPTADAPAAAAASTKPTTAKPAAPAKQGAAELDGHDHGAPAAAATFGDAGNVLAEFGHTHDHAEAATLLDPQTRATLKSALDRMWQSEGELRQGRPELALPFAYEALAFIKKVQQAERIYLARLGPELPPIDMSRRLGGDRAGLASRGDALQAATPPDPRAMALWQALAPGQAAPPVQTLQAFAQWLQGEQARLDPELSLSESLETARAQPDCLPCRERLRGQLWRAVARPPAQLRPRMAPDAVGQRYLDALQAPAPSREGVR
ncbi:MAG TPA: DUF4175 family protein [Stenotrophomonas sp.]|jgi:hypothetical protein